MKVAVGSRPMSVHRPRIGPSRFVMTRVSLHVLITSGHGETPGGQTAPGTRLSALSRELFRPAGEDSALGAGAVRSGAAAPQRSRRRAWRGLRPLPRSVLSRQARLPAFLFPPAPARGAARAR